MASLMRAAKNILVVEDHFPAINIVSDMLRESPNYAFNISMATTLKEAMEAISNGDVDIILLDLNLPDSKGLDTLRWMREENSDIPIVVFTGEYSEEKGLEIITHGAQEYILKTECNPSSLNRAVRYAMERKKAERGLTERGEDMASMISHIPGMFYRSKGHDHDLMDFVSEGCSGITGYSAEDIKGNRKIAFNSIIHPEDRDTVRREIEAAVRAKKAFQFFYRIICANGSEKWIWEQGNGIYDSRGKVTALEGFISDITQQKMAEDEMEESYKKLAETLEDTVNVLAATVDARDQYTAGHQKRVAQLSFAIAKKMDLDDNRVCGIYMTALIHDIGKIHIPINILINPRTLTELEMNMIRTHSTVGYDILKKINSPWPIAKIVLQHHERMDGSGYPNGTPGAKILLEAKILAIADVIEAMASNRPYRPALGIDAALAEVQKNKGQLYDKAVAGVCLELFQKKKFAF
jgi:PAS domain S-box-containing protein/putative nucleotidyltransferase with HDIG domain